MNAYVLSLIGSDRTGLVAALSAVVAEHGGSWERSQLTELAGVFAGVVLVHVPDERSGAFQDALAPLRDRGLMDVALQAVREREEAADADGGRTIALDVVGADRPGIVQEVSEVLASLDVGIVELATQVESAAHAGSPLFRAAAVVTLPRALAADALVDALQGLSDDLMVDVADN